MDTNMQLTINSFRQLIHDTIFFPDISMIFSKIPDISPTAVEFSDISRSSRQAVTLIYKNITKRQYAWWRVNAIQSPTLQLNRVACTTRHKSASLDAVNANNGRSNCVVLSQETFVASRQKKRYRLLWQRGVIFAYVVHQQYTIFASLT